MTKGNTRSLDTVNPQLCNKFFLLKRKLIWRRTKTNSKIFIELLVLLRLVIKLVEKAQLGTRKPCMKLEIRRESR